VTGFVASGQQWNLAADGHEATVVEVGGGVREYAVDGVPQLLGYAPDQMAPGSAGALLVPWPNRIRDGRYSFDGAEQQLALTDPKKHNASHGLLRWAPWRAVEVAPDAVTLEALVPPQPGYPHRLVVRTRYGVGPTGLRVDHEVTNAGPSDAPFGFGAHPYLYVDGSTVDALLLHLPGTTERLITDDRGLPIGREEVAGTGYDFTEPRRIGTTELDTAFAVPAGEVTLSTIDGRRGMTLWMDGAFRWVQVFTADALPAPRRRKAVAVEPMTCPPDAFNSGEDLVVLAPGGTWRGSWGITPLG
jgi:aldose 1-epimerase